MAKNTTQIRATLPQIAKEYIEKNKYLDCAKVTVALWLKYVDDPSILDDNSKNVKSLMMPVGDIGDGVMCYGLDGDSAYYVKMDDYRKLKESIEE